MIYPELHQGGIGIRYNAVMQFSTLFFDLDATLYSASNGLWDQIRNRIYIYMHEVVGLPMEDIPSTRDHYWKTYGTTLEGLRIHHQVKPDHYLDYVHDIPLSDYLDPDPDLLSTLTDLPQQLWVFTNADSGHARRVLRTLKVEDCFTGIVDLFALEFKVKPRPESYQTALKLAGEDDPTRCVMFDDLLHNLLPAKQMGFTTVLVGDNSIQNGADFYLGTIHEIREKLPQLWSGNE
jgi:pyrimidine 5'-nucleotidase